MIGRLGRALVVAAGLVAVLCVLVGWLQGPAELDAADAVDTARRAFRSADVDAEVDAAASPGVYEPASGGGPVAVWRTTAVVDEATVVLFLRQTDGTPVYLDDRQPDGAAQVLSDAEFSSLVANVEHPARRDHVRTNIVRTVAAALVLATGVLYLAVSLGREP